MPRQNLSPKDFPQAVLNEIEQLGQNIAVARKRRGETQAQWARKLGVSQPTMARIERGDPSVAMASYVMCMWLINQAHGLAALVAPHNDQAALEQEVARAREKRQAPAIAKARRAPVAGGAASIEGVLDSHLASASRPAPGNGGLGSAVPMAAENAASYARPQPPVALHRPDERAELAQALKQAQGAGNATAEGLAALLLKTKPGSR